ncbi:MAG: hypothetical protein EHM35_15455, partial [Planctomycetaceae bacterium]
MNTQVIEGRLADHLSARIESLQEGFRNLSRAATLKDLAARFTGIAGTFCPGATMDVLFRPGPSAPWEKLVDGSLWKVEELLVVPPEKAGASSVVRTTSNSISIVQRLVDRSYFGVVLAQMDPQSTYASADVISLRLFVHLFENAYQEQLHLRNEKDLIFSLNHRILQLNSLIDTGIEVAKLNQDASPQHLALERAASLTNASRGMLQVTGGGQVREKITFPDGVSEMPAMNGHSCISSEFSFQDDTYTFALYEKESRSGIVPFDGTDQLLLDALARHPGHVKTRAQLL